MTDIERVCRFLDEAQTYYLATATFSSFTEAPETIRF